jgi:hypothetical protein
VSAEQVSRRAVAALFLERQALARPRTRRLTGPALQAFVEQVCGLQIDSVNVIDRAHHLTLWSRFGPYDRATLERLVYRRRLLFEYLSHVACFVSTGDLPIWRGIMAALPARWKARYGDPETTMPVAEVERAIAEAGVLGNADFERPGGEKAGGWWSWKPAQHALDYLWKAGRIGVHSRVHFQKRYDLIERVLPGAAAIAPPSVEEFHHWHVRQSLHAMGAATGTDLRMYLTYPPRTAAERRKALEKMLRSGEVVEIAVAGDAGRWLALAEDLPALEAAARRRSAASGSTLLSPFDSFLWHRERTRRLFGFDYRIEVYTPGHRRVHGYYALPIVHDGHLIGRLDAKTHRAERRLEVRRVYFEPWLVKGAPPPAAAWSAVEKDAALAGLADSLGSLATFVGAARVTLGRVVPARLRPPLARALRGAPPAPPRPGAEPEADREPASAEPADDEVPV